MTDKRAVFKFFIRPTAWLAAMVVGLGLGAASYAADGRPELTYEQRQAAVMEALNKVLPAVVTITTDKGGGSGVIIDGDKGYALTNEHVVRGDTYVTVTMLNGQKFEGSVIRNNKELDLALIKIIVHEPLPEAVLGDSYEVKNSDPVLAIGSPRGLNSTVTMGEITKSKTKFTFKNKSIDWMVIHSAPINRGNSGGPLVNLKGEVIGLNSMVVFRSAKSDSPFYYAVSSHEIKTFADSFIPTRHTGRSTPPVAEAFLLSRPSTNGAGEPSNAQPLASRIPRPGAAPTTPAPSPAAPPPPDLKPYLGLTLAPLSLAEAQAAGVNPYLNFHQINWLDPDGPAARAGLATGDVLVNLNDRPIRREADYKTILREATVGGTTWAEVIRQGQSRMIPLTIGGMKQESGE